MAANVPEKYGLLPQQAMEVQYSPAPYSVEEEKQTHGIDAVVTADQALKRRIRMLRFISRVMATLLSIGVFVPMAMMMSKFLSTRDIYRLVAEPDGTTINRTAWALQSKNWPTYMYFAIATVSLILNLCIMLSYLRDIRSANRAATIATFFTALVTVGNVVVWFVAVVIYRYEKDTNGVSNDLWGWSCSKDAEALQEAFSDVVQFEQYCNVQSTSWYIGLAQTAVSILSGVILFLAFRRRSSKAKATDIMRRTTAGF